MCYTLHINTLTAYILYLCLLYIHYVKGMLSTRHVGWARAEVLGGRSLLEFSRGDHNLTPPTTTTTSPTTTTSTTTHTATAGGGGAAGTEHSNYVLSYSKQAMIDLHFIAVDEDSPTRAYIPSEEWEILSTGELSY